MNIREIIRKKHHKIEQNIPKDEKIQSKYIDNDSTLNLTCKNAQAIIKRWSNIYTASNTFKSPLLVDFDDTLNVTMAKTARKDRSYTILLGMKELSSENKDTPVKDMDFLKAAISLYHEIAHYEDDMTMGKTKEDLTTEFWTYGNKNSYFHNWPVIPYEIRAEHKGVMTAWERICQIWPDEADNLMIKRLSERAETSNYIIKVPDDSLNEKFQSKDQINKLFEEALKRAQNKRHCLSDNFLHSTDEITQMMTTEPGILRPEYASFYLDLMYEKSGSSFDQKMASLVAYIHPKRNNLYPELDFDKLNPEKLFRMRMPELAEEIQGRIVFQDESDIFCNIEQSLITKWDYKQIGQELEKAFEYLENVTNSDHPLFLPSIEI